MSPIAKPCDLDAKARQKIAMRKWYLKNREQILAKGREAYNRPEQKEKKAKWAKEYAKREGVRERQRKNQSRHRQKNLQKICEKERAAYHRLRAEVKSDPVACAKLERDKAVDAAYMKQYAKAYYAKNKARINANNYRRYLEIRANPVKWRKKLDSQVERVREWRKKNPDKMRAGILRWKKTEKGRLSTNASKRKSRMIHPEIMIKHRIRCRINQALKKGAKKIRSTRESLGCDIPTLRAHLESLFMPGMTWENRGQWEIDHIRPCASFNLLDPEQQKCCFHYTNLQPLWRTDNRKKSDKWA